MLPFWALSAFFATLATADIVYLDFPASVDQATRDRVQSVMQNEFNQAGANITVSQNAADKDKANRTVKFHDSFATPRGDRWGDSGDGKTVNVYVKEFTSDDKVKGEFSTTERLGNGLGETAAHEVGHTYGCNHNNNDPPTKMTEGGKVTAKQRGDDNRLFNATDAELLKKNAGVKKVEPKKDCKMTSTVIKAVQTPPPADEMCKSDGNLFFDAGLMATGTLSGWFDLGYIIDDPAGFAARYTLELPNPDPVVTLLDDWCVNWALRGIDDGPYAGQVFPLENFGQLVLLNPRPGSPGLYQIANMVWDVNGDSFFDVFVTLNADAKFASQENGFYLCVPLPGAAAAGCIMLLTLLVRRRRGMSGR